MSEGTELQRLRGELAEARIELRARLEEHKVIQAERELAILTGKYSGDDKNMGSNQAARDRAMIVELTLDDEFQVISAAFFNATTRVTRLEAELDGLLDLRREREWGIRDGIRDALLGREVLELGR